MKLTIQLDNCRIIRTGTIREMHDDLNKLTSDTEVVFLFDKNNTKIAIFTSKIQFITLEEDNNDR